MSRRRSLRSRLTLLVTAAVALAIAVCAAVCWFIVRGELLGQVERSLDVPKGPQGVEWIEQYCSGAVVGRMPIEGTDEIARLGASFNAMTAALAGSRERQRRLIADAGHELRTPLTSLRTNVDLLLRSENTGRPLDPAAKRRLLAGLKAQFEEMSTLVGDLLQLSRPADEHEPYVEVAFHDVVGSAVRRAGLRAPDTPIDADLESWYVHGDPAALERAVVNLLDNAVKFSTGPVTVRLRDGELTVRDHGPGIPADELPYVFDRFWRSPSARSMPGSGLGLAIVAQAVRDAEGEVTLENAAGGGTVARVRLPGSPARG